MHTPAPAATARTTARTHPARRDQIRHVRHDLAADLSDCPVADDIILIASELAANAVIHSNSARPGGTFTVRASAWPGEQVRIEVRDGGGPWPEQPRHPAAQPGRPHGLDLITALATAWGITGTAAGRIVWARINWPATP